MAIRLSIVANGFKSRDSQSTIYVTIFTVTPDGLILKYHQWCTQFAFQPTYAQFRLSMSYDSGRTTLYSILCVFFTVWLFNVTVYLLHLKTSSVCVRHTFRTLTCFIYHYIKEQSLLICYGVIPFVCELLITIMPFL